MAGELIKLESVEAPLGTREDSVALAVSEDTAGAKEVVSRPFEAGEMGGPGVGMLIPESLEGGDIELAAFDTDAFGAAIVPCLALATRPDELDAATAFTLPVLALGALAFLVLRKGFNFANPFLIVPPPACFGGGVAAEIAEVCALRLKVLGDMSLRSSDLLLVDVLYIEWHT